LQQVLFCLLFLTRNQQKVKIKNLKSKEMIKNIVLIHGAFTDGSCYAEVIRYLQEAGFNAIAVQNPLTSLAADA